MELHQAADLLRRFPDVYETPIHINVPISFNQGCHMPMIPYGFNRWYQNINVSVESNTGWLNQFKHIAA